MGYVNVIWQGDANAMSLQAFDLTGVPAVPLNVTGPECLSVRELANNWATCWARPRGSWSRRSRMRLLNNASQAIETLWPTSCHRRQMLPIVADWVSRGGDTLNKPTHFQTRDGRF